MILSRQSIPLHPERIRRGATLLTPAFRPTHSLPLCFVASLHTCLLSPRWSPVALPWETPSISFPLRPLHDFSHHNEGGTPIAINLSRSSMGRRRPFSLTPVFPAHPKIAPITPLQSALPKLLGLKSFRIRTYEKNRGEGLLLLTKFPTSEFVLPAPERSRGERPKVAEGSLFTCDEARLPVLPCLPKAMRAQGTSKGAPMGRGRVYAAFISLWGELLRGLNRAELHTLAGIALCSRLVVN